MDANHGSSTRDHSLTSEECLTTYRLPTGMVYASDSLPQEIRREAFLTVKRISDTVSSHHLLLACFSFRF